MRVPLGASVTLLEATTPVKLPTKQCLQHCQIRLQASKGPYFKDGSTNPGGPDSQPPAYPTHHLPKINAKLQQRFTGSFRPVAGNRHLHRYYNFTELTAETVPRSLHHSCRSELTRQGISLP